MQASHYAIATHRLVILAEVNTMPQIGATFFSNSRSLKLLKKQPRESRKRRGSIMSTPSISVFTIFIVFVLIFVL